MFSYDLREKRGKDVLIYGPSRAFRILCLFFIIFIAAGFFIVISESGWSSSLTIPLLVVLVLILSLLYRDEWVIDNRRALFISIFGIGPFVKRCEYRYEDIRRIEVVHFIKGLPDDTDEKPSFKHRAFIVLRIKLKGADDEVHQLEIMPEKSSGGKLERIANLLSAYTGLELYIDRPRDESVNLKSFF